MAGLERSKGVKRGQVARVDLWTRKPEGRVVEIFFSPGQSKMQSPVVDVNSPKSVREAIRNGGWSGPTSGVCPGFLQAKYESSQVIR